MPTHLWGRADGIPGGKHGERSGWCDDWGDGWCVGPWPCPRGRRGVRHFSRDHRLGPVDRCALPLFLRLPLVRLHLRHVAAVRAFLHGVGDSRPVRRGCAAHGSRHHDRGGAVQPGLGGGHRRRQEHVSRIPDRALFGDRRRDLRLRHDLYRRLRVGLALQERRRQRGGVARGDLTELCASLLRRSRRCAELPGAGLVGRFGCGQVAAGGDLRLPTAGTTSFSPAMCGT